MISANQKSKPKIFEKSFQKKFLQEKILFISSDFVSYGDIKKMLQSQSPWGSLKGATRWLHQKISSAKISSAKNYPRSYLFVIIRRFYGVADFLLGRPNHKRFILDFFQFFFHIFFVQTSGNVSFLQWQLFLTWNRKNKKVFHKLPQTSNNSD